MLFHLLIEAGLAGGHDAIGIESELLNQGGAGVALEEEILLEGKLTEQLRQHPMDLTGQGDIVVVEDWHSAWTKLASWFKMDAVVRPICGVT